MSNNRQGKQELVLLTRGKDDKVEIGVEFIRSHGDSYILRVRAEKLLGDWVVCRVIPDSWNSNQLQIRPDDWAQNLDKEGAAEWLKAGRLEF